MVYKLLAAAFVTTSLLACSPAMASMSATATADLNIRSGPGPQFAVVGVITAQSPVEVDGCIEGKTWCQVNHNGTSGWSYAGYLATGPDVVIANTQDVPHVSYTGPAAAAGAAGGVILGALVGGPIGAVVGGAIGAGVGASAPPPAVTAYVTENRYEPVYLDGEVVVGAGVPEAVELSTIPDYEYRYAVVNGQTVLVDSNTRQIVYVYR
jgi:uncharacterized protein YraI